MEWATHDPDFRVKLLRFVDVLPSLRTSEAIADHVRQYFREDAPVPVRLGSVIGRHGPFRPVLSTVVRQGVFAMAGRFIVGADPAAAMGRLDDLVSKGVAYTVDLLGEATLSAREADAYRDRYLEVLNALGKGGIRDAGSDIRKPNLSIKLSALTSHFEPAAPEATFASLRDRVMTVLATARKLGAFVNIDAEQYRYRDLTHEVLERLVLEDGVRDWPDLGIVVQAYLKDSLDHVSFLRSLSRNRDVPMTVRLVKGAYWDEEVIIARQNSHRVPVFENKAATDLSFERCTEALVEAYPDLIPAFASHNPRGVAQAMVRAEAAGVPSEDVEFQMLYGMAKGLRDAVRDLGYRVRVYVPAGKIIPGMGYLVRRLLENTSNESWLVSKHEQVDPDVALGAPRPPPEATEEVVTGFRNHPPLELHLPDPRAQMKQSLERIRDSFGRHYPMRIGGEEVESDEWLEIRTPAAPSSLMGRVAAASASHARTAVTQAREAFPAWRDRPARDRAEILRRAADRMDTQRYDLAAVMVYECAKPWREADGDVTEAIDFLRYYAEQGERLGHGVDLTRVPGETNRYLYEGRGVVGVIAPWNFPLAILTGMTSAALVAGNSVVMKPAEQSPVIASRLTELLHEAGVPKRCLHYLPGLGPEAGRALVEHRDVDMIAFTGGNATGLAIARTLADTRAGQRGLKKLLAELGGKNALIVDDDADLDLAVEAVLESAFGYAGQKCSAASRVIVVGSAYPEFRERLAWGVESLPVGPPEDPGTVVPPLISREARDRVEEYVAIGLSEGKLVAKGEMPSGEGHYVAPHVFEAVALDSRLSCEEIFGPVLTLYRAEDFDEALSVALDSDFALTGGVFSRNPRNIAHASVAFRVGNLYLNRGITGAIVGRQPFGGFRMSGTGDKAGGPDYVEEFTIRRVVTENTMRRGFAPERGSETGTRLV